MAFQFRPVFLWLLVSTSLYFLKVLTVKKLIFLKTEFRRDCSTADHKEEKWLANRKAGPKSDFSINFW